MTASYVRLEKQVADTLSDSEEFSNAVAAELRAHGVDAQLKWGPDPLSEGRDRDVVLIILAVGAASMMIGSAVKKVIDAGTRGKPTVMTEKRIRLDAAGNPVRDRNGNPAYETTETPVFAPEEKESTTLNVANVFEFRASTGAADSSK